MSDAYTAYEHANRNQAEIETSSTCACESPAMVAVVVNPNEGKIRIPDCQSILEVLRLIRRGDPEWADRSVTLCFPGPADVWVLVYPRWENSTPYFDVQYTRDEPPRQALAGLLERYPQCAVLDWSPGRLACIEVLDESLETLAQIIQDVVEAIGGERITAIEAFYEQAGRA
ncbi:hypothetical protein [Pseudomonas vanderleydeniana]|uniref:Uncharacterized protein n=1 Tax=Pseudomonas vanderleydeniana TaxID=2745495 RepID=A0A9E6PR22_9PSED|nr:hypothetical protein [Pseudomonas vanderleydeniana]QXI31146.1 hypothetical protein HU752_014920 [Pseudomonas vanderleydeniana]